MKETVCVRGESMEGRTIEVKAVSGPISLTSWARCWSQWSRLALRPMRWWWLGSPRCWPGECRQWSTPTDHRSPRTGRRSGREQAVDQEWSDMWLIERIDKHLRWPSFLVWVCGLVCCECAKTRLGMLLVNFGTSLYTNTRATLDTALDNGHCSCTGNTNFSITIPTYMCTLSNGSLPHLATSDHEYATH